MYRQFSTIKKLAENELSQVAEFLFVSDIGKRYYPSLTVLRTMLIKAYDTDCMYVIHDSNEIAGILWFKNKGAFYMYPYLHMIYIKEAFRKKGYGKIFLDFLENYALNCGEKRILSSKIFLVVGMWNETARIFYENNGYIGVGVIPGLFKKNVDEYLMMKACVNRF